MAEAMPLAIITDVNLGSTDLVALWHVDDSPRMNLMRSPMSTSRSSFDSSQPSPMSMGSMESPLGYTEPVFTTLQSGLANIMFDDTLGLGFAPYLEISEQPQDKFRFRYVSEMHGTHGCILGVKKSRVHKTYPSVELKNYTGDAIIRCSLYTIEADHRVQHPHTLVAKNGSTETEEPHDKVVPCINSGYKVDFQGIGIIHTARKKVCEALFEKKKKLKLEELGHNALTVVQQNDLRESAARDAKTINLNSVCLCFEAFTRDSTGRLVPLCNPVYSNAIHNMKSALTGELKMTRIDRVAGSCRGNEEIFIFVEKVNKKNIKVRFFEVDEDGNETWQDFGKFTELDVHHQYAIAFKTPPYKDVHLMENKEVYLELYRPSDGVRSECKKFTYKPQERDLYAPRKRARTECESTVTSSTFQPQSSASAIVNENVFLANLDNLEDMNHLGAMSITTESFEQFLGTVEEHGEYFSMLTEEQQQGAVLPSSGIRFDAAPAPQRAKTSSAKKCAALPLEHFAEQTMTDLDKANQSTTLTSKDKVDIITKLSQKKHKGDNALHTAIKCSQMNILVKLLRTIMACVPDGGPPLQAVNEFNSDGQTPLYLSVLVNKPKMLEALLQSKADPLIECKGTSPLQLAVELNNNKCVEILLKVIPSVELTKENIVGYPLLHQAIEQNNKTVVGMLLNAGADPTQADTSSGCTPLHMAVKRRAVPIVQLLLADKRVDVNAANASSNTSLHIACVLGDPGAEEICKILLDAKANPWLENSVPAVKAEKEDGDSDGNTEIKTETQEENEVPVFLGQTAFDLASHNSQIMELLRQAAVSCEADEVAQNMELMELKTEPLSPVVEDALDADTLEEVAQLLQQGDAWKELAQCMGLEHHIPDLEKLGDSARKLLLGCMGQVSTGELRELLEALNQRQAMEKVDAMMARRLAQLPNNL